MLVSIGSLSVQSPDYKDLVTSLESQLCDEGSGQEKVCCQNKVGGRNCFSFTDRIKCNYWFWQEINNGLRVDPNIARDSYPWMARLGSRFSIFKTMIQGELKISIFPCKPYLKYIELTNSVSQMERDLPNKFLGLFLLNSFACLTGFHWSTFSLLTIVT